MAKCSAELKTIHVLYILKSSTPNILYAPRLVGQLMKFISEIFPALIRSLHWTRFLRINKARAVGKTVISLKPQGMNKGMQKLSRSIIVSTPVYESAYPLSPLFHPMMSKTSVNFGMNHMIRSLSAVSPLTPSSIWLQPSRISRTETRVLLRRLTGRDREWFDQLIISILALYVQLVLSSTL